MPAGVVLVHGAWHGAWCFDRVLPRLRDAGVDAVAIDLPGHGEDAAACFYNDCDAGTVAWAVDRLGPHPMVNLGQAPTAIAWRARPSTYVVCREDLAVHPDVQRLMAQRCTTTLEWPTGHSPFLSRPDLLAGLLADLAHRAQPAG